MFRGRGEVSSPNEGGGGTFPGQGVVNAGLNAAGPVGGVAARSINAGASGGFGAGLSTMLGGLAAFGVSKAIGSVMNKLGDAEQESIRYDTLKRSLGDVNVSFTVLRDSIRHAAAGMDTTFDEAQQAIFVAPGQQMQGKADAPEKFAALEQQAKLWRTQKAAFDQVVEVFAAEFAACDPGDRVYVPQSARTAFDIRFQIVNSVVVTMMASLLFAQLALEKVAGWPDVFRCNCRPHAVQQGFRSEQQARLHQPPCYDSKFPCGD